MILLYKIMFFLTIIFFSIPIITFGLYGLIILYFYNKNRNKKIEIKNRDNGGFSPYVSIIVPTHNEEFIILKKIKNLLDTYYDKNKLEIIFVDDSSDTTPLIILKYVKKHPIINLFHFDERLGYNKSIIYGCKYAKGEIIILSDAGSLYDKNTISNIVGNFKRQHIGAVTGNNIILNINEKIGKLEKLYIRIYNIMRTAESHMDSTFWFKGEASAVRKSLISDFTECNASFDTSMALYVRRKGFKAIYDPKVKFYEYTPKTHKERVKQKTIRAINLIKMLLNYKDMVFKPRFGKLGLIILPMHFAMIIFTPLSIVIGILSLFYLTLFNVAFFKIIWSIIGIFIITLFVFQRELLLNMIEFTYVLIMALYHILFTKRKHDMIDPISSTRR